MAVQLDLFRPARRPAAPKPPMQVIDAGTAPEGVNIVRLECTVCGHTSPWLKSRGVTAGSKGRVCPACKGAAAPAPTAEVSHKEPS